LVTPVAMASGIQVHPAALAHAGQGVASAAQDFVTKSFTVYAASAAITGARP
jgi:hypothetical protein